MRRSLMTLLLAGLAVGVLGAPASAKGITDHAKVTVTGAGLPGGIVTLGADGGSFVAASGVWDDKWDAPNIGGALEPSVRLGPAFDVRVVLRCDGGGRSRYDQTLYPNAPEGPQLFTPQGVEICGESVPSGYDGLGYAVQQTLRRHGIRFDPLTPSVPSPERAEEPAGSAAPGLAAIGVPFAIALVAGEEIVRRRRRRR